MSINIRKVRRPLTVPKPKKDGRAGPRSRSKFTPQMLEQLRDSLVKGEIGIRDKIGVSDDIQDGLRALIRATGLITFHAHYAIDQERPNMKVGHYPTDEVLRKNPNAGHLAIEDARKLTATIRELGNKGIDVQEGLHERLLRELREQGTNWRVK